MTYSIVARDEASGQMGVAVQSHYFSVGPICPWGEAGVGVVATQSLVDPSYGPLGLHLMRTGKAAADSLRALLAADPAPEVRQVAMLDQHGNVAGHTGDRCISAAGHTLGKASSCQANMMLNASVWDAMDKAFGASQSDLANRLLAALDAAELEGGDIRGKQSAAILIVSAENTGRPWVDRVMDLRVEDHPDPLLELRRLIDLKRAYEFANDAEQVMQKEPKEGLAAFEEAMKSAPGNVELRFWFAVSLGAVGRLDEAVDVFAQIAKSDPGWANWKELLKRLPASGLAPEDPELLARLKDL
ncbi:MAG: DUF1028 domain-containing protein [Actinomycetota bacterium]|nr:DUF1028 domain-containing protein [Actinomycetota bacterium]